MQTQIHPETALRNELAKRRAARRAAQIQARIDRGETQASIARDMGITRQMVHKILKRARDGNQP